MATDEKHCEPPTGKDLPVVVGIGASAGGLEALRALFSALNEPTNASYIVVQHMAPNYRSLLAELIGRESPLTVKEAEDGERLKPNVVYVTPPNRDILLNGETVKLEKPVARISPKPSVDRFFFSLGEQFEDHCGGIVLSGTGSDGTQGILAIKAAGGFTIAQSPESAKYDGMPNSAIQTGAVDHVLSPHEIAAKLCAIIEEGGRSPDLNFDKLPTKPFNAILEFVRRKKRVDFSQYKPNTLTRRIKRRMGSLQINSMEGYLDYLKRNVNEVDILYRDLTISVTSFFRDTEHFQALTKELTKYLKAGKTSELVRAWSAGCSTGEEAYSLAILIHNVLQKLSMADVSIQIFATDINEAAMDFARKGIYSPVSLEAVPPAFVKRYFDNLDGKYAVKKFIREMVVFAKHDLTANAPFMKMDLICCRNVFIYFAPHVQEKIFKIFHYSLNTKGILFLGKSESISVAKHFFDPLEANAKIFERAAKAPAPDVYFSSLPPRQEATGLPPSRIQQKKNEVEQITEAARILFPDSIIVDSDFNVLEIAGAGSEFLQIKPGKLGKAIDAFIIGSLKSKVLTLLHRAKRSHQMTKGLNFTVAHGKKRKHIVDIIVLPFKTDDGLRFVISLSKVLSSIPHEADSADIKEVHDLEQELTATREHLQTVIEEQETSNEELQALNEELQSTNEELQSTNEELETSNEELQSANEELTTLNEEMNVKTGEVMSLYGQVNAIQSSIRSPLLVVDRNMNIMRYNEPAGTLFSIDAAMVEKGVYLTSEAPEMRQAFDLLHRCVRSERPTRGNLSISERSYIANADPVYDDKRQVTAAVLSLVDNTEIQENLELLETSERKLKSVLENTLAPVCIRDPAGRFVYVNKKFCEFFDVPFEKILGRTSDEAFEKAIAMRMRKLDGEVLGSLAPLKTEETYKFNGYVHHYVEKRFALIDHQGAVEGVCTMAFDVTEQVETNRKLLLFKQVISSSNEGLLMFEEQDDGKDFQSTFITKSAENIFGKNRADLERATLREMLTFLEMEHSDPQVYEKLVSGACRLIEWKAEVNGVERWYEMHSTVYRPKPGEKDQARRDLFCVFVDVTARKENERLQRETQEEVIRAGRLSALGEMAAGLAHEINTPLNIILAQAELLRADHEFPPASLSALGKIESTVDNIASIIKGLKSMARIDTDRPLEVVQLNELIKDTVSSFLMTLRHKGIRLTLEMPNGEFRLLCRPAEIGQVLLNLVNNSVDAVQKLEEKWIKIELKRENDVYLIRVSDSGDGIPEQHLSKIMTPFYTTKKTRTGLGLSLSSAIVRQAGGTLSVDVFSKHTCFEVRLPIKF